MRDSLSGLVIILSIIFSCIINSCYSQNIDTIQACEWMEEGLLLQNRKEFDKALKKYLSAANLYKENKEWKRYETSLSKIFGINRKKRDFKHSLEISNLSDQIYKAIIDEDPDVLAWILYARAKAYFYLQNFGESLDGLKKAININEKYDSKDTSLISSILQLKGAVYFRKGDPRKMIETSEQVLLMQEEYTKSKPLSLANNYHNLGSAYMQIGDFEQALTATLKALKIREENKSKSSKGILLSYGNLAAINAEKGDFDKAMGYLDKVLEINSKVYENSDPDNIKDYTNKARLLELLGQPERCCETLDYIASLQDMTTFRKTPEYAYILRDHAMCLKSMGKYEQALDTLLKSYSLVKELKLVYSIPEIEADLGETYLHLNQNENAIRLIKRSIERIETLMPNSSQNDAIYAQLGMAYKKVGRYDEAEKNLLKGYQNVKKTRPETHPIFLTIHNYHIDLLLLKNDYKKAFEYQASNKELKSANSWDKLEYFKLKLQAGIQFLDGEEAKFVKDSCEVWLSKGIKQIETSKTIYLTENERFLYQNKIFKFCEQALQYVFQYHEKPDLAFQIIEEGKGFILLQNLKLQDDQSPDWVPDEIVQLEATGRRKVKYYENELSQNSLDSTDLSKAKLMLIQSREEYEKIVERIYKEYPNYGKIKFGPSNSTLNDIRDLIKEEEAVLSFFDASEYIYILKITNNDISLNRETKGKEWSELISNYLKYNEAALFESKDSSSRIFDLTVQTSIKIYDLLLKKSLAKLSPKINTLIIVPDGDINLISIESLIEKDQGGKDFRQLDYLIKKFNIAYSSSLTLLNELKNSKRKYKNDYLGFGPNYKSDKLLFANVVDPTLAYPVAMGNGLPDLPAARKAVEYSSQLFNGESYLREAASKVNFLKNANSSAILHLAMHGIVDHKNPMKSKLVFSKAKKDSTSQWLNASEIYNLQLDNQLSVLTACNTGVGELKKGEGVMSLSRAFNFAGSPSLMMSLWSVPDVQTAEITKSFFQNIKNGAPKHIALRNAKLEYLNNTPKSTAHPMYWAGFIISGNTDPIELKNPNLFNYFIVGLIIMCLLIFFGRKILYNTKRD